MEKDGHHFTYISNDDRPKILQYSMVFSSFFKLIYNLIFTWSLFSCSIFSFKFLFKISYLISCSYTIWCLSFGLFRSLIDWNYNSRFIISSAEISDILLRLWIIIINNFKLNSVKSKTTYWFICSLICIIQKSLSGSSWSISDWNINYDILLMQSFDSYSKGSIGISRYPAYLW